MLRIIIRTDDAGMATHVGGTVWTGFKTFDVDLPEVERHLREADKNTYAQAQIVGVEVVEPFAPELPDLTADPF